MYQQKKFIKIIALLCIIAGILYMAAHMAVPYWYKSQFRVDYTKNAPKILIVWYRGIGEQETIERLKIVSDKLGYQTRVVSTHPPRHLRWFIKYSVAMAREIMQPDFILTIQDWVHYFPGIPNYMTMTLGTERYISADDPDHYELINTEHYKFDALLPSFKDVDQLQSAYETSGKKYQGFSWYPTSYITDYPIAEPKKLFYSGGFHWDTTRGSPKYKEFFIKLDQTGYFQVCGPKKKWRFTPNSAIGFIPIDGKSLLAAQHAAGISLLLHTQLHLNGGAPTGRIFEAVAAKTVIISDRNPFIEKNFGDNVLYIDVTQSAEEMFKQVDAHMQWIYTHPREAQKMAENCYNIFLEKFTMEAQLAKLVDMHITWQLAAKSN